jgi:hypothetical protein
MHNHTNETIHYMYRHILDFSQEPYVFLSLSVNPLSTPHNIRKMSNSRLTENDGTRFMLETELVRNYFNIIHNKTKLLALDFYMGGTQF